jgi:hypothetical protein
MTFIVSDIRDAVTSIRQVLTKADDSYLLYIFEDGQVKAMNRNMRAGIPIMFDQNMVVPAAEFDRVLKVCREDPDILIGPQNVVVKSGKTRVTLPRLDPQFQISVEDIEGDEVDLDDDFIKRLKMVTPLLEESPAQDWMSSVICLNGKMITTQKGQFMLACDYEPFAEENVKALLPIDLVRFLHSKKDTPSEMIVNQNAAQFKYDDDSWVTSSLFGGKVPGKMFSLLDEKPKEMWEPTDEHRSMIKDCITLGAQRIQVEDGKVTAEGYGMIGGSISFDIDWPHAEGRKQRWTVKHLDLAFSVGESFDFISDPQKCIFSAENLTGLMAAQI